MKDIESPRLLYFKGALLLSLGVLASAMLIWEHPGFRTAALLIIAIWAFARAYYFAFYVIEHYVDGNYRFAGLTSFVGYVFSRRRETDVGHEESAGTPKRESSS